MRRYTCRIAAGKVLWRKRTQTRNFDPCTVWPSCSLFSPHALHLSTPDTFTLTSQPTLSQNLCLTAWGRLACPLFLGFLQISVPWGHLWTLCLQSQLMSTTFQHSYSTFLLPFPWLTLLLALTNICHATYFTYFFDCLICLREQKLQRRDNVVCFDSPAGSPIYSRVTDNTVNQGTWKVISC